MEEKKWKKRETKKKRGQWLVSYRNVMETTVSLRKKSTLPHQILYCEDRVDQGEAFQYYETQYLMVLNAVMKLLPA
jgi:hypothetical protein